MDDGALKSGAAMDLDFMDELLYEGYWLETSSNGFNISQQFRFPCIDPTTAQTNLFSPNPNPQIHQQSETPIEGSELGRSLRIGPRVDAGPSSSVKKRLMQAIGQLKEYTKSREVLVQIWVPTTKEGKNVLTTIDQPCLFSPKSESLASYRHVSETYHFSVEGDCKDSLGLPGRVFLGELPESTPDVCFFRSDEYPRKTYAKQYNIRGSLAVPIFARGTGTCLGVVEVVTTSQNISYRPELETICKALEAVDLKSSQDYCPPSVKACKEFCQAAVPELSEILGSVCKIHNLPLALTWARCFQQGKGGCRHFDEKFADCISTVDSACLVADEELLAFHVASSEQYLYLGQGIVGKAFMANKQCFATDIAAFSKTDYPLSHHAKVLNLHAAVAIPLRSTETGLADFVLELFLPKGCLDTQEQKQMKDLLPIAIQQACRCLHVVMDVLEEDTFLQSTVASDGRHNNNKLENHKLASSLEGPSWIAQMMEAQQKGKQVYVSWDSSKEPKEEFKLGTHWGDSLEELCLKHGFTEYGQAQQKSGPTESVKASGSRKTGEKRRTKTEKTISLEVLRQYFAGSLKDAAKSIGVCPTTLKRICRQYGITRWPSRKLKKVGHSLKKLQLVIDSVQGAEGAIQIGSFYTTFPELTSPNAPFGSLKVNDDSKGLNGQPVNGTVNADDDSKALNAQPVNGTVNAGATVSKSPSSSSSHSSGSSICCSTEIMKQRITVNDLNAVDSLKVEDPAGMLKRTRSDAELHASYHDAPKPLARSQSQKTLGDHPNLATLPTFPKSSGAFRVKANFGEEKVRLSLQPNWDFKVLQQELGKRYSINDMSRVDLKYLDDDNEWVLLTCDADLEECKDIYRMCESRTIRISLHQSWQSPP